MDRALRKTADECIRERNREYRMRLLRQLSLPERECCFRNRTPLRLFFVMRGWLRRAPPSIPSRARFIRTDSFGAMHAHPEARFRVVRIRLTQCRRWVATYDRR